jgi:hypothetical protein
MNCMVLRIKRLINASLFSKNFLEFSYSVSSKIAKINKVKTINIERELTELQSKKQASNREEIENRINLLENELKDVLSLKKPLPRAKLFFSISTDIKEWSLL